MEPIEDIRTYPEFQREFVTIRRRWYIVGMAAMAIIGFSVGLIIGLRG